MNKLEIPVRDLHLYDGKMTFSTQIGSMEALVNFGHQGHIKLIPVQKKQYGTAQCELLLSELPLPKIQAQVARTIIEVRSRLKYGYGLKELGLGY